MPLSHTARTSLAVALVLAAAAPASAEPAKPAPKKPASHASAPSPVANHRFTADLFRQLTGKPGNVVFSPWSIQTCLGMVYSGARGQTEQIMRKTLRLDGSPEQASEWFAGMLQASAEPSPQWKDDKERFTLNTANKLWAPSGAQLFPAYVESLHQSFLADAQSINMADTAGAAKLINTWVNNQTRGLIPTLVSASDIHPAGLVLTNAVYFQAKWQSKFNKEQTSKREFTLADGTKVQAQTMFQSWFFEYQELPDAQVVRLNYRGDATATIILPAIGKMQQVIDTLDISALNPQRPKPIVELYLPKLKFETRTSLRDTLTDLGMGGAFEPTADFAGIAPPPSYCIQDVIHAATLTVDENETKAAAATAVTKAPAAEAPVHDRPPPPIVVDVNRPFLMLVQSTTTGAVLFAAKIDDPR